MLRLRRRQNGRFSRDESLARLGIPLSASENRISALSPPLKLHHAQNKPPRPSPSIPPALDSDISRAQGTGVGYEEEGKQKKGKKESSVLNGYLPATFGWSHRNPPECQSDLAL